MDLFEYQGKQYFARFGIPISKGGVADTVDEAVAQAEDAGVAPDQIDPERHDPQREEATQQVEPERGQHGGEHQSRHHDQHPGKPATQLTIGKQIGHGSGLHHATLLREQTGRSDLQEDHDQGEHQHLRH